MNVSKNNQDDGGKKGFGLEVSINFETTRGKAISGREGASPSESSWFRFRRKEIAEH